MVGESPQAQRTDADLLRRVCVRPIQPEERARWDALVHEHHYLGLRALFGKTLRYPVRRRIPLDRFTSGGSRADY